MRGLMSILAADVYLTEVVYRRPLVGSADHGSAAHATAKCSECQCAMGVEERPHLACRAGLIAK